MSDDAVQAALREVLEAIDSPVPTDAALQDSGIVERARAALAAQEEPQVPVNPKDAFAYLVARCAEGFGKELIEQGKTATEARNTVIRYLLAMAAGEACRIAHREGREPDNAKWRAATDAAFERAVKRTAARLSPEGERHG